MVYLINLSEADFLAKKNKFLGKLKTWITENIPGEIIPYSADFEKNFATAEKAPDGIKSMLPKIIKTGYTTLELINYFTCGED